MTRAGAVLLLAVLAVGCSRSVLLHSVTDDRALINASAAGDAAEVRRLIAAGADVNYHWTRYGRPRTALSEAVHARRTDVIEILEKAGAHEW